MSAALDSVALEGDWRPLLSRLEGWASNDGQIWNGPGARLTIGAPSGGMKASILAQTGSRTSEIIMSLTDWSCRPDLVEARCRFDANAVGPRLNHVAIDVAHQTLGPVAALKEANCSVFLPAVKRFDPSENREIVAEHIVDGGDLYLTARINSATKGVAIAHVGWQVSDRASIDKLVTLLREIRWRIAYGAGLVDGSYLVHFEGPDGRVHDFFFVERSS